MTLQECAAMLDGREYAYDFISKAELKEMKENGIVVVYGASDDLMEFDGAIVDEAGVFDGGTVFFDENGVVQDITTDRCIEAIWCDDESDATWSYKTDIEHETFDIMEDGEVYCRGIVFFVD